MNELRIFNNPEFGEVRTVTIDGEYWFVGNDIARVLEYKDLYSAMRKNVDERDKRLCPVNSASGVQQTTVINESGLYSLIMSSKLPKAKDFRHWVTSEVLPTLARTGEYKMQKPDSYTISDPVERAKRWIEEQEESRREKQALEEKVSVLRTRRKRISGIMRFEIIDKLSGRSKRTRDESVSVDWLAETGEIHILHQQG